MIQVLQGQLGLGSLWVYSPACEIGLGDREHMGPNEGARCADRDRGPLSYQGHGQVRQGP